MSIGKIGQHTRSSTNDRTKPTKANQRSETAQGLKATSPVTPAQTAGSVGSSTGLSTDDVSIFGIPEAELTPKVREAVQTLMGEVASLRDQLNDLRARLQQTQMLADQDPLFDILNRRAFVRDLDRTLAQVTRYDIRASLVFIDLNGLKKINDTHGHPVGDKALSHVVNTIARNIRSGDSFGRLGGDEFGLILMNATPQTARTKTQVLAKQISQSAIPTEAGPINISIAYGVIPLEASLDIDHALARADAAMYQEKS